MISAIVLAAGQSTRMGEQNKLLLPFRGTTLIEHMVDVVTRSPVGETLVVLGHEAERVRPLLAGRPVRVVDNADYAEGQASSIRAGLAQVSPGARGVMVCLTDQPLLEPADLERLIAAFEGARDRSIVVPLHRGQRGNPVLFSMRHRDEVLHNRGKVAG